MKNGWRIDSMKLKDRAEMKKAVSSASSVSGR